MSHPPPPTRPGGPGPAGARARGGGAGDAAAAAEQRRQLDALKALAEKHHIRREYITKLRQLRDYKVVLLCDDSDSMGSIVTPGPGAPEVDPFALDPPTRWTELRTTCEVVVELACTVAGGGGIDVHFLNRRAALKGIHSAAQLRAGFPREPNGRTPLTRAFNDVLAANRELPGEKKLLVLIATDGEPDGGAGGVAEFRAALAAKPRNCKVQILKVSDDDGATAYLDELDGAIDGVDVTDDYYSVLDRVRKYRGPDENFSFGDYLIKCIIGPFDVSMDGVDEPPPEARAAAEAKAAESARRASAGGGGGGGGGGPAGGAGAVPAEIAKLQAERDEAKHEAQLAREGREHEADQRLCIICLTEPKQVALQPCGHLALCVSDAARIIAGTNKCPVCRMDIVSSARVFL